MSLEEVVEKFEKLTDEEQEKIILFMEELLKEQN